MSRVWFEEKDKMEHQLHPGYPVPERAFLFSSLSKNKTWLITHLPLVIVWRDYMQKEINLHSLLHHYWLDGTELCCTSDSGQVGGVNSDNLRLCEFPPFI